jgi:hypothetical protein
VGSGLKKEYFHETRRTEGQENGKKIRFFSSFVVCLASSAVTKVSYSALLRQPPFRFHSFGGCCMGMNLGLFNSLTATVASAGSQTFLYTRLVFAYTCVSPVVG